MATIIAMSEMSELAKHLQRINEFYAGIQVFPPTNPPKTKLGDNVGDRTQALNDLSNEFEARRREITEFVKENIKQVNEASRELHRYAHDVVDERTFGTLSDELIEQARKFIEQRNLMSANGIMDVHIAHSDDLIALAALIAHFPKSNEQARDDVFGALATEAIIDRFIPLLNSVPTTDNAHFWFLSRALLGVAGLDGIIDFDDIIQTIHGRTQRLVDLVKNSSSGVDRDKVVAEMQTLIDDGIFLKAAISQMNDKDRADARDSVKHTFKDLLKATRKANPYLRSTVRSELRALFRSLSLSSELARSDAGVYFELATESAVRRHIPLGIPERARIFTSTVPVGVMITVDNMFFRAALAASVMGQTAQLTFAKSFYERERERNGFAHGSHIDAQYLIDAGKKVLRADRKDAESFRNINAPDYDRLEGEARKCAKSVNKADSYVMDTAPFPAQVSPMGFPLPPGLMRGM